MDVKKEITRETKGGRRTLVVTPDIGKVIFSKSIGASGREQKKPDPWQ
jgi:hypothetical protein